MVGSLREVDFAANGMAMSRLLELTASQRSCVFLKDVMEYSLAEISELHDTSVTAVKATLHRGRARLRALAAESAPEAAPVLDAGETILLAGYVERFNARDFDGLRAMLADDVRLDLVGRAQRRGAVEVGEYFHRYSQMEHVRVAAVASVPPLVKTISRGSALIRAAT